MQEDNIQQIIEAADQLLSSAEREMQRSHEDVVTHVVCHSSRQSLANYLKAYLLQNGRNVEEPAVLDDLLKQCQSINSKFNNLDISNIHCRFEAHDSDYCLSVSQVDECLIAAKQAKDLLDE